MIRFDPQALIRLREAANLSRKELGVKIGATRAAIHFWETGKTVPSADWLPLLTSALDCRMRDLFTDPVDTATADPPTAISA
jgi:DNA-binding XRE family transcriptional regulator